MFIFNSQYQVPTILRGNRGNYSKNPSLAVLKKCHQIDLIDFYVLKLFDRKKESRCDVCLRL